MRVLFVSSGNVKGFGVVPFIKEQGASLERLGIDIEYYPISEKGIRGYLRAGLNLRKYLKNHHFDIIHAHFTLSGLAALIGARQTPIVLSLMGSDAYGEYIGENKVLPGSRYMTLLTYLIQPLVKAIISKSKNIDKYVYKRRNSFIIPNGINVEKFKLNGAKYKAELNLEPQRKYVLFLGDKDSVRKNISLAQDALAVLHQDDVELLNPYPVSHKDVPKYLSTANVLAVCSYMEGSPNVVKEAMACNCPIVATDVGDIKWVLGDEPGCYVSSFKPEEYAAKLKDALQFSATHGRTNGAARIKKLGLDSETVARRIINVYEQVIRKKS